jgi:hypothetical protein
MIGTTPSTSQLFHEGFRKLGFIHCAGRADGGLQVHSSLLNLVVHDWKFHGN